MEGMGEDMEEELEDDGQSELARMQKANLGDSDLAEYAIKGNEKVCQTLPKCKLSHRLLGYWLLCSWCIHSGVGRCPWRWEGERERIHQSSW